MAPRRVHILLALEVEAPWRPTNGAAGDTQAYPRDEHCQSTVRSAADPRRVAQARHRTDERGPSIWSKGEDHRRKAGRRSFITMPTASRLWICRADDLVSSAVRSIDYGAWPTTDFVSPRIRLQNGSQIKSRKHAAGNRLPAISSAMRSSSADFNQWAFAIDGSRLGRHWASSGCHAKEPPEDQSVTRSAVQSRIPRAARRTS